MSDEGPQIEAPPHCPDCHSRFYKVLEIRPCPGGSVRRKVRCEHCGRIWSFTAEAIRLKTDPDLDIKGGR